MRRVLLAFVAIAQAGVAYGAATPVSTQPRGTHSSRWIAKSVVYGVVPRNFGPKGAKAVTDRLDHLQRLGVKALWLSPINATPPGDFGYAVTDYNSLRPDFGTDADLKHLVSEAHRRGIRVLMDFVPNHTSDQHPYFKDAEARGKASPYYDFYARDAAGKPTHYFDWAHLPNLNYDNPKVREHVLSAMTRYVRDFDVDGFRLDVAWGIRQRYPSFWRAARQALKAQKPDVALIAEASARDPFYAHAGFDAAYDWTENLGEHAWDKAFDDPKTVAQKLHTALAASPSTHVLHFLNNNDTGPRFITKHGLAMTRAATGLLLTLPGVPLVFTGDEVGAEFLPYEKNPKVLDWKDRHHLEPFYRKLITLRDKVPALTGSHFELLPLAPGQTSLAYFRAVRRDAAGALVAVNFDRAETLKLTAPPALARTGALRDVLTGERYTPSSDGSLSLPMSGHGIRVLVPDRHGD